MSSHTPAHGTQTHGAVGASCFKCGAAIAHGQGHRYLGHDWCAACARSEAQLRLRRRAASHTPNGDGAAEPTPLRELPATIQSLIRNVPLGRIDGLRDMLALTCGVGGPLLLAIGLAVVLMAPAAVAGGTLTLSGAILISAVVRRR